MSLKKPIRSLLQNERSQNLILRVFTVACKFLLSILIINKLGIYEMGVFGIFSTTVTLLIYVLGLDFYTYNTREILKKDAHGLNYYLTNQIAFHGFVYLLVLPLVSFLFLFKVVDLDYAFFFYAILIAEHISQELYRILIVLKKSVVASIVLFVRSGLWIVILYVFWLINDINKTIGTILFLWLLGGLASIIMGLKHIDVKLNFRELDKNWILKGVYTAAPFFISTIFYKIIEFSGRYFLDYYNTKEAVGIFTFFYGISNVLFVFVHATVIIVMSPYIVESVSEGMERFTIVFDDYKKQVLKNASIGFLIGAICIYPFLLFFDNQVLSENILVFFILLVATFFFCCSYIPHYKLYAFKHDRKLLLASVFGAIINLVCNFVLVPIYGVLGASIAQAISMLALFLSKVYWYKKFKHE